MTSVQYINATKSVATIRGAFLLYLCLVFVAVAIKPPTGEDKHACLFFPSLPPIWYVCPKKERSQASFYFFILLGLNHNPSAKMWFSRSIPEFHRDVSSSRLCFFFVFFYQGTDLISKAWFIILGVFLKSFLRKIECLFCRCKNLEIHQARVFMHVFIFSPGC